VPGLSGTDLLVCRVPHQPTRISRHNGNHAPQPLKNGFRAPEAASAKDCALELFRHDNQCSPTSLFRERPNVGQEESLGVQTPDGRELMLSVPQGPPKEIRHSIEQQVEEERQAQSGLACRISGLTNGSLWAYLDSVGQKQEVLDSTC
jgi:hypothetical protein